ncbi:MAG TPA: zinc-dependent metalloprotease family protein, partial [Pyrinomonadaceae bacterium]|nr:zinc-dependent metalloprotease family protein [Pyrinomonadaceae bacterium]
MNLIKYSTKLYALIILSVTIISVAASSVFAGEGEKNRSKSNQTGPWRQVDKNNLPTGKAARALPETVPVYRLNQTTLNAILNKAPLEFTDAARRTEIVLEIPTPEGNLVRFRIEESPILAPGVAAQFPTWKTFSGQGIDDPMATARFDVNALGFHGYVISANGTFLIDPYSLTDKKNYVVYYKGDINEGNRENFSCKVREPQNINTEFFSLLPPAVFSNGTTLRNFRLAVSATRFYTNFFGGNQTTAFAAIQTTVNRMNTIYRRELAVTFTLVSDTRSVFTNANDGGFTNNSNTDLDVNQTRLNAIYTSPNYDIGHVLSVTPNPDGLATSPSLCDPETKAQGFTGAPTPQGDGFDVDYVAHEIGHQFSMSHTYNNDLDGSCGPSGNNPTRSANSAYEPASGVTIMGYAGICAPRNLAANSIEYFNLRSFDQALGYLQTTIPAQYPTCGSATATGNTPPQNVNGGGNFNIPKQTPFTLTASATDADGDALTY